MFIFLLITQIGYSPDNLILLDVSKYQAGSLFLAEASNVTPPSTDNLGIKKPDKSWIITEPAGEILGGIGGFLILDGMQAYCLGVEDYGPLIAGGFVGYSIGSCIGLCLTGKHIEKEKGNFFMTFLGCGIGTTIDILLTFHGRVIGPVATTALGLICYRLSLK